MERESRGKGRGKEQQKENKCGAVRRKGIFLKDGEQKETYSAFSFLEDSKLPARKVEWRNLPSLVTSKLPELGPVSWTHSSFAKSFWSGFGTCSLCHSPERQVPKSSFNDLFWKGRRCWGNGRANSLNEQPIVSSFLPSCSPHSTNPKLFHLSGCAALVCTTKLTNFMC